MFRLYRLKAGIFRPSRTNFDIIRYSDQIEVSLVILYRISICFEFWAKFCYVSTLLDPVQICLHFFDQNSTVSTHLF